MPTFPTYRGELPECLNPLNLRHYLLLLYWIFFRPTALKCYLYQADPELYASEPGLYSFVKTWDSPPYRNLYLMVPNVMVLVSVILHFFPILIKYWEKDISFSLAYWIEYHLVFTLTVGLIICILGSIISNIAGSILLGVLGSAMLELHILRDLLFFELPTSDILNIFHILNILLFLVTFGIGLIIIIVISSQMKIGILIPIFGLLASLISTIFFDFIVDEKIAFQETSSIVVTAIRYIMDDVFFHLFIYANNPYRCLTDNILSIPAFFSIML